MKKIFAVCCLVALSLSANEILPTGAPLIFGINEQNVSIGPEPSWVKETKFLNNPLDSQKNHFMQYPLIEMQYDIDQEQKFLHIIKDLLSVVAVQDQSNIEIEFDPAYESVMLHYVTVHRGIEKINKIPNARMEIIQQEADMNSFQYNGKKTWMIFLDDIQQGDIIDYAYSRKNRNPVLKGHFCDECFLQAGPPINRIIFRFISAKDRPLYFTNHYTTTVPTSTIIGDKIEWLIDVENIPSHKPEDSQPDWYYDMPRVQISDFRNWQEVAEWGAELFEFPTEYSSEMKQRVENWKSKTDIPEEQILHAVRFVQNDIRYLGFEIGPNTHKPNDPNIVLQRRFGDCKDKTVLLKAFVDLLGFESHPVLVNTWMGERISDWHPTTSIFNHVILQICIGKDTYFIDPTNAHQGGNLLKMNSHPYKNGLILHRTTK